MDALRGQWCFACDAWVANAPPTQGFWERHLASALHIQAESTYTGPLDGEWDGVTVIATICGAQLQFRDVANTMRRHGYTLKLYPNDDFYIITYNKPEDAEKSFCSRNACNGAWIKTRPKFHSAAKVAPVDINKILLDSSGSWEQQARDLAVALRIPSGHPLEQQALDNKINRLCTDVQNTLMGYFPYAECFVYGSRVTGLAGADSDVDIYVKLDWTGTEFDGIEMSHQLSIELLKKCDRLLRRKSHMFTNILSILKARIPVTHALHLPTLIECDLTCKNMMSVHNSRFINYIASLDERIFQLFLVLKQWKKTHQLPMSTYSITMLAIHYLQTLRLLPPVQVMKDRSDPPIYECNWICSFCEDPFEIKTQMPLRDMLVGFFRYLSSLEFGLEVICPLLGTSVEKWRFEDVSNLPVPLQEGASTDPDFPLVVTKPACVQDPFELNHNVTKGLSQNQVIELITMASKVADYCDIHQTLPLLDMIRFVPLPPPNPQGSTSVKIYLQSFTPPQELIHLTPVRELWFKEVQQVLLDVFLEILQFRLEEPEHVSDSEGPPCKMQRLPSCEAMNRRWTLTCPYMLMNGRKKQQPIMKSGCRFTKEFLTSSLMVAKFYQGEVTIDERFHLRLHVDVACHEGPTHVVVSISNNGCDRETFRSMGRFLSQDLPSIVENSLINDYRSELQTLKSLYTIEEQMEAFGAVAKEVAAMAQPQAHQPQFEQPQQPARRGKNKKKGGVIGGFMKQQNRGGPGTSHNPFLAAIEKHF